MTTTSSPDLSRRVSWWSELFGSGPDAGGASVRMRMLSRGGQPFLLLPSNPRRAVQGLELYPAQRSRARLFRKALGFLLKLNVPGPAHTCELAIDPRSPLMEFVAKQAGPGRPDFAVLAGNPNTPGRRFIILIWDSTGRPVAVVKAGTAEIARGLIQQEVEFLKRRPESSPGIPRVLDSLSTPGLSAFAIPFIAGRSPVGFDLQVGGLLRAWLIPGQLVSAADIASWRRLCAACSGQPGWAQLQNAIEAQPFVAAIVHGDFAPWNLRTNKGAEVVALDWERGEHPGLPAWDWFHFVVQTAVLVQRKRGLALVGVCRQLLQQADFVAYAKAAGIAGRERQWLLAYLHHVIHILRPTEGRIANQELLAALTAAWIDFQA